MKGVWVQRMKGWSVGTEDDEVWGQRMKGVWGQRKEGGSVGTEDEGSVGTETERRMKRVC